MTMSRPVGATMLALLGSVRGLFWTIHSLTTPLYGILAMSIGQTDVGATNIYLSVAALVVGLVTLFLSYGLWYVRPWAWMWIIILQVLGLALEVIPIFFGGWQAVIGGVSFGLSVLMIVYLLTPGVRAAYLR